ncbi:MAG: hypothetical protein VX712_05730 [Bacteroidota bacterium]|uniref:Uncharacterized protein n=1 Tax=Christiangramia flava JLT2011 TaxID=1229726 RepID=A0A1L7I9Y3_9FLAO|nr:hypothetical protein [Christiangramia flava]APU69915.1 hypothetical protein GRFL_3191 [Christiangramia flava JLT2011]MAM18724.1 hypothetical protein [Christiangramia sp.]MEE2771698.1 hypothetical protein [Bacteroidota bacterium]OSS37769.1 hypothetical protein C723_3238 [Christiangramia flava JLT2011]|tara:strand:+ start:52 stop:426 length:375 start_codon:yes stop_codon:yes gene_type:complete
MFTKEFDLDFGKISIYQNILIARLNEGVLFDVASNRKLLEIGKEIFKDEDYGYISYRLNSYAVDPMVYFESASVSNLKAIAVVSDNEMTRRNADEVERKFYKNSSDFEVFTELNLAISWIQAKI